MGKPPWGQVEGSSKELHKMERFWRQKQGGATNKRKEEIVSAGSTSPGGKIRGHYCAAFGGWRGSLGQFTSLVLTPNS